MNIRDKPNKSEKIREKARYKKMQHVNTVKGFIATVVSVLTSLIGALAIPVLLLVMCNIIDYVTALIASPYRGMKLDSNVGIHGIAKKVCMWLLVVVGSIVDGLLKYSAELLGITLPFTFLISCVVAVWLVCNELISILENISDIGVKMPPFLNKIVLNLKSQVENAVPDDSESVDKATEQQSDM